MVNKGLLFVVHWKVGGISTVRGRGDGKATMFYRSRRRRIMNRELRLLLFGLAMHPDDKETGDKAKANQDENEKSDEKVRHGR